MITEVLTSFGVIKFLIYVVISALGWLVARCFIDWVNKKCHSWSHNRKYVKIERFTNYKCTDHYDKHTEDEPLWASVGVWLCQEPGCNAHGTTCFGNAAWWKIEHGQMVIDEKKMTDPGDYNKPKAHMNRIRAERDKGKSKEPQSADLIMAQMKVMEERLLSRIEKKIEADQTKEDAGERPAV